MGRWRGPSGIGVPSRGSSPGPQRAHSVSSWLGGWRRNAGSSPNEPIGHRLHPSNELLRLPTAASAIEYAIVLRGVFVQLPSQRHDTDRDDWIDRLPVERVVGVRVCSRNFQFTRTASCLFGHAICQPEVKGERVVQPAELVLQQLELGDRRCGGLSDRRGSEISLNQWLKRVPQSLGGDSRPMQRVGVAHGMRCRKDLLQLDCHGVKGLRHECPRRGRSGGVIHCIGDTIMLQAPLKLDRRIGEVPVKDAPQLAIPLPAVPLEQTGDPHEPQVVRCRLVALTQPLQPHLAVPTGPACNGHFTKATTGPSRNAVGEEVPICAQETPQSPERDAKIVEGFAVVGICQPVAGNEKIVQAH